MSRWSTNTTSHTLGYSSVFRIAAALLIVNSICVGGLVASTTHSRAELITHCYYTLANSVVKTKGFPAGGQLLHAYGIDLEYKTLPIGLLVSGGFHESMFSIRNASVVYRNFSGYDAGLGVQKYISAGLLPNSWVVGLVTSFRFDRYSMLYQYMVYPSLTVRTGYTMPLGRFQVVLLSPLAYHFRQSGGYFTYGISLHIGLRL